MKKVLAILLSAMMLAACAACATAPAATTAPAAAAEPAAAEPAAEPAADSDWSYISDKKTLVVGITEYAPMNYYDADGTLIGFDTELTQAICQKLGVEPVFQVIEWDNKEIELSSKNIDCIWNGLTVTEERKANMDFTDSYLENRQAVVIRAADAAKFTDAASFAGCVVVAEAGSAGATAVQTTMPDATFTEVTAQSDALLEVLAGTADAAVVDITMATATIAAGTDYAALSITSIEMPGELYAVGFRTGSDVTEKINAAMTELYADGTMTALAEKYELSNLLIVK